MARCVLVVAATVALLAAAATSSDAATYVPRRGHVLTGLAGDPDFAHFRHQVGRTPAVYQAFVCWGDHGLGRAAHTAWKHGARLMLHISTYHGPGTREVITPRAIALGRGDRYLLYLHHWLTHRHSHAPVYLRVMAEMNGHWNPYSAYDSDGHLRPGHHQRAFREAWRRIVLIVRGGRVARIDRHLRRLGLPRLRHPHTRRLRRPRVSFMWVPQIHGSPDLAGNEPNAYWPGAGYVDWVGTDYFSRYPNFPGLSAFYAAHPHKPFVFGEWAVWDGDNPGFVRRFFGWLRAHKRVRMVIYNHSVAAHSALRIDHYPRAARALRRALRAPRYSSAIPARRRRTWRHERHRLHRHRHHGHRHHHHHHHHHHHQGAEPTPPNTTPPPSPPLLSGLGKLLGGVLHGLGLGG